MNSVNTPKPNKKCTIASSWEEWQTKLQILETKQSCGIKKTCSHNSLHIQHQERKGRQDGYDDPDGPVVDTSCD
jgi:hypothetical protein